MTGWRGRNRASRSAAAAAAASILPAKSAKISLELRLVELIEGIAQLLVHRRRQRVEAGHEGEGVGAVVQLHKVAEGPLEAAALLGGIRERKMEASPGATRPNHVTMWLCDHVTMWPCDHVCLLYTSPSPRDVEESRMPSSA